MGFFDNLARYLGGEAPPILAEQRIPVPWNAESGAIVASATAFKHYQDGTSDRHLYALERVTVINNSPNCDVAVSPNGDLTRRQVLGRGGGSYVIDMGNIAYLQIENLSGTTAIAANEVLITGEAYRRRDA